MTTIKSLILGSAAGLLAIGGAQAADLPVKAKAVEYVKVCSLYGAGFYYIPGSDTCLKIGGFIRVDTSLNSSGVYGTPFFQGAGATNTRSKDYYTGRVRANLNMDTRTATEYGVVRTFVNTQFQWSDSTDGIAGGNNEVDYAFIQFAGFTFGKAVSQFDTQWVLSHPSISSGFTGGSDDKTGIPQIAYTASLGNGLSATISAETTRPYRTGGIYDVNDALNVPGTTIYSSSTAGNMMPDIVANLRLDQAWGSLHFAGALHQVAMTYNGANETTGHFDDKLGYALTAGFEIKNLPTGVGDTLRGDITYANGATRYVFGGTSQVSGAGFALFNGNNVALGNYMDAVFASPVGGGTGTDLQLATDFGARLFFEHYWNPAWRTSLWGSYARHENTGAGNALMVARYNSTFVGSALTGDANFSISAVGSRTAWTPVKNLTFSAEIQYAFVQTGLSGTLNTAGFTNKTGLASVGGQGTFVGQVQALRSF
ncbi:porin [Tardiphaga sp.]|uniref:porin n=1 Tax=Tardiphaga sp. TaxID=1926292 RepID=UPI002615983E|nr:porin [Tardiphaga sp.]MDB5616928.1 putative outer membrane protein putative porin [Tardiphaga sp.]